MQSGRVRLMTQKSVWIGKVQLQLLVMYPCWRAWEGEKVKPYGTVEPITNNSLLLPSPSLARKSKGIGGGLTWNRTTLMIAGRKIVKEARMLR